MVYFTDSKAYFEQSKLLLQARPTTTKITTKYTLPKPTAKLTKSLARQKPKTSTTNDDTTTTTTTNPSTTAPKAVLTLRTYDPVSGTVLKYQTDKQAEVGRLIAGLGRCARTMAALPDGEGEEGGGGMEGMETEAGVGPAAGAGAEGRAEGRAETPVQGKASGGGGGGGGGKKKKNNKK